MMAAETERGRRLAVQLARAGMPLKGDAVSTCSLIARHAKTYCRIQEGWCDSEYQNNNDRARRRAEAQETRLEARITELVAQLPEPAARETHAGPVSGPFTVQFQGDPRGATVGIYRPGSDYCVAAADE